MCSLAENFHPNILWNYFVSPGNSKTNTSQTLNHQIEHQHQKQQQQQNGKEIQNSIQQTHQLELTLKRVIYFVGNIHLFFPHVFFLFACLASELCFFPYTYELVLVFPRLKAEKKNSHEVEAWTNECVWVMKVGNLSWERNHLKALKKFTLNFVMFHFRHSFKDILWFTQDKPAKKSMIDTFFHIF